MVLSDSTLGDWVGGVHDLLDPLMDKLREHVFAAKNLHADDTPLKVLAPGTGKTKTARLWVYAPSVHSWISLLVVQRRPVSNQPSWLLDNAGVSVRKDSG